MKVLIDTPDRLVLEHRPILFGLGLVALTLLLVYAAMIHYAEGRAATGHFVFFITAALMGPAFWFAVERVQVTFDRHAGTVTWRVRRLSGDRVETYSLDQVTRAMLQTRKGDHDSSDTHRVALVLGADRWENRQGLTRSYRSGPQAERIVGQINRWLDSARATP
ncbi:hypothetical protein [Roseobacter sinensis]|uniref:Uncharacterized protein n=1 Tax=Roseobacter sinensis TaxID=2931391 RepID=A0ABT3BE08_9RHOB|nr:hypothetical protein [Roseobacter sp. WL0113]MCV3271787.1 hypothetical protein [Roseobacter sp. WL0113]